MTNGQRWNVATIVVLVVGAVLVLYWIKVTENSLIRECRTRCAPFQFRPYQGCECMNEKGHWVPQETEQ